MDKNAVQAMKKAFIYDEKYQALLKEFKDESRSLKMMKNLKVPQEIYTKHQNEKINALRGKIRAYVKIRRQELQAKMAQIEQSYKPTQITDLVTDPAQELIRRQNVQARVALMTDNELRDHFRGTDTAHDYDLFVMKQEADKRGLTADYTALFQRAKQPFINNPEYQELKQAETFMVLIDKPDELTLFDYDEQADDVKRLGRFDLGNVE